VKLASRDWSWSPDAILGVGESDDALSRHTCCKRWTKNAALSVGNDDDSARGTVRGERILDW